MTIPNLSALYHNQMQSGMMNMQAQAPYHDEVSYYEYLANNCKGQPDYIFYMEKAQRARFDKERQMQSYQYNNSQQGVPSVIAPKTSDHELLIMVLDDQDESQLR